MKKADLFEILAEAGIRVVHVNSRGWAVAKCPFAEFLHEKGTDHSPSFNIKIDPAGPTGFKCFTCHQHGGVRALIAKLGYYRDENLNNLALRAEMKEIPEAFPDYEAEEEAGFVPAPVNAALYLAMYPLAWEDEDSRAYLRGRGIGEATAAKMQLRFDPERRRVVFPVFDYRRELYGLAGRSIVPDQLRSKEVPKVKNYAGLKKEYRLLGEHLIDNDLPLFVVEGLFALAHIIEIGCCKVCNPVATLGSALSVHQRDIITGYDRATYLCYDDDFAGNQGLFGNFDTKTQAWEGGGAIDLLKEHVPTLLCQYPERTGDPDRLTYDELVEMMGSAILM
jgi:hypothetical protein